MWWFFYFFYYHITRIEYAWTGGAYNLYISVYLYEYISILCFVKKKKKKNSYKAIKYSYNQVCSRDIIDGLYYIKVEYR